MSDEGPRQYWLRNQEGRMWGPMQASTIHLLVGQGAFPGRLQASTDGVTFGMIGRFPDLREGIDTSLWGVDPKEVEAAAGTATAAAATAAVEAVVPSSLAPDAVLDPSALAPGAALDPSALAPDAVLDPSAFAPDAVFDPSALAPDAALDPSALAPDAALDPSALAPDAALDPSALAPDSALDPSALASTETLPESGDLEETSALRLAYLVLAGQQTCRITFEAAPTTTLSFRRGHPEHVASEDPELDVGAWLVAQGVLQPAQRDQAEGSKASFGGSVTAALFGLGLLDPGAAFPMLAAHAKEAYLRVLATASGPFRVALGEGPPPDAIPLGVPGGALLTEAVRRLDTADLARRLGDRRHAPVMRSNASSITPEDLRLGPQETRALGQFDGVRPPDALAAAAGIDPKTVLQTAYLLGECGIVSFGEPQRPAEPPPAASPATAPPPAASPATAPPPTASPATAPPPTASPATASSQPSSSPPQAAPAPKAGASPPPDAPPPEPIDWAAEEKRVGTLLKKWQDADPFRILDLQHHCTDADVKQAFTRMAKLYHPDRATGAPDGVAVLYRAAFDRVREAHTQIATAAQRREILNALAEAELAKSATPAVDEGALAKVRHLVKTRHLEEAATLLDEALAANPGFAAAWAWRAWVKVLRAKDPASVKREVIGLVQRALKFDPRCGDAHLNAARVARRYGDTATAAKHEKQARALGVNDPL
jgi:hypothetical protein